MTSLALHRCGTLPDTCTCTSWVPHSVGSGQTRHDARRRCRCPRPKCHGLRAATGARGQQARLGPAPLQ